MLASVSGARSLLTGIALALAFLGIAAAAWSHDEDAGDRLLLELQQLRSELDSLRDQLEIGGEVADVRFEGVQASIDRLADVAVQIQADAAEANRTAEAARRSVADLTTRVTAMEGRIASLPAPPKTANTSDGTTTTAEADAEAGAPDGTSEAAAMVIPPALPKDRPTEDMPSRLALDDGASGAGADEVAASLNTNNASTTDEGDGDTDNSFDAEADPETETETETENETETETETVAEEYLSTGSAASFEDRGTDDGGTDATSVAAEGDAALATAQGGDERATSDFSATFGAAPPVVPANRPDAPDHLALDDGAETAPGSVLVEGEGREAFETASRLFEAGDFSSAFTALRQAIDSGMLDDDDEAEAVYMLGTAYLRAGEYPLAIQVLAQGLRSFPTSDFAARSILSLADALTANGQRAEGCRLLSFVPIEYPLDSEAISDASSRSEQLDC